VPASTKVAGTRVEPAALAKRTVSPRERAKPAPVNVSCTPPSGTPTDGDSALSTGAAGGEARRSRKGSGCVRRNCRLTDG